MVIVYICKCDLESNTKSKVGVRQASFWYSTFSSFHVVEEKRNLEMAFFKRSRARSRRLLNALDLLTFLKQNEVVYKSDLSQEHDFYRVFQQLHLQKKCISLQKIAFSAFFQNCKNEIGFLKQLFSILLNKLLHKIMEKSGLKIHVHFLQFTKKAEKANFWSEIQTFL